jgi:hypothetical protein
MTRTCDCCKRSVEVVSEDGLCFACEAFHAFAAAIKDETDLSNEEALDLASDLSGLILSAILERLQLPGNEQSLLKDLLETMEPREKPN